MSFKIISKDKSSRARTGVIKTAHGEIKTPAYVIVGTHAKVRTLTPEDLKTTRTQVIISNTYHLWQKFTSHNVTSCDDVTLENFPGIHKYMGWDGPVMTDSGGFQVFSLGFAREHKVSKISNIFPGSESSVSSPKANKHNVNGTSTTGFPKEGKNTKIQCLEAELPNMDKEKNLVKIKRNGAIFHTEKGKQFLGPKESMRIQKQLGADIILAFDECTSPLNDYKYTKRALKRTHRWEKQSLKEFHRLHPKPYTLNPQLLYGIVQGGEWRDLREKSAKYIGSLPFDGIAIGGSLGKSKQDMWNVLDWTIPLLPDEKPRHLLGIGQIEDLFRGVEHGIDTFDCVIPTREARHGRIWTAHGHFDIIKKKEGNADPLESGCECYTCNNFTRKDIHEAFKAKDQNAARPVRSRALAKSESPEDRGAATSNGARLASIHNVFFFNTLMSHIRESISKGTFRELKEKYINPSG